MAAKYLSINCHRVELVQVQSLGLQTTSVQSRFFWALDAGVSIINENIFVILSRVLKFNAFCSVHFGEVIMSDIFFIWGITIHSIHFNMYYIHIFIIFNINNLQVLCIYCYSSLTNITKKGIWQEPLWEMPSSKPSSLNWVAVLNVEKSEIEMMHSKK